MAMENIKSGKLLYHLTKLSNLDSILENGLAPRKLIIEEDVKFADVADPDIISKRNKLELDNYTPFHFHPYSAFDVAVKNKYNDEEFFYICITRKLARENEFKILCKHPLTIDECNLMDYDVGFENIDWDTMHTRGTVDDYSKHVKMAECLTNFIIPVDCFHSIAVRNIKIKSFIEQRLIELDIMTPPPYINVMPWFD
ncbi:DarT ssDNA thymidine ADP-ribosyltransferase family protein [Eubacteriaceae bacterium ES2]|nr:DarT ssDNA thymidine ADP-ribosyltransferase family protein [Eubacteriaceae bacterium ES2]